jgi:membrane-associated protease RseP (regulator of RpoE activity)
LPNDAPSFPALDDFPEITTPLLPADGQARPRGRLSLHLGLFILTLITATLAGANFYASFLSDLGRRAVSLDLAVLTGGLWYSGTFLVILGAHEAGHYLYCRRYGLDVSLPYFIPLPPPFMTGTLGAVIRIRDPFRTRAELFDVGIAGPFGGLIVLVPALFLGLSLSTVVPDNPQLDATYFGDPLMLQWAASLVLGPVPDGSTLNIHPIVWGCWFGMFATALNLMPFGQLDGGHVVYAIFGDRVAAWVSVATVVAGMLATTFISLAWAVPTGMLVVMWRLVGLHHPPPLNPYTPPDTTRRALAAVGLLAFLLSVTPEPVHTVSLFEVLRDLLQH